MTSVINDVNEKMLNLMSWKIEINIFKSSDTRVSFYSHNINILTQKPKSSFRHLKWGIQEFHMKYFLFWFQQIETQTIL